MKNIKTAYGGIKMDKEHDLDKNDSKAIILSSTIDSERICASAAKISTTQGSALEIYKKAIDEDKSKNLISKVLKSGHTSIIEHINFSIAFDNVSVFVEQFMIEFRLASFTVKSRRYVDFRGMGFYTPDLRFSSSITQDEKKELRNKYIQHMEYLFEQYEELVDAGVPKEDARFILPYCYKSNFYCTVNARELVHIIDAMINGRGSSFSEIESLGESLLDQARKICPYIFDQIDVLDKGRENKIKGLDQLLKNRGIQSCVTKDNCELMQYTADSDCLVASIGISNHMQCTLDEARKLLQEDSELYTAVLHSVLNDKRKRELEHVTFTFKLNNLSLAGLTHLVRHRIQSISVPVLTQLRKENQYIVPPSIEGRADLVDIYHKIWNAHKELVKEFLQKGIYKEDLVYFLLSGDLIDVVTTMNGRELYTFIQLRTCLRAQWEIRQFAIDMLKKVRKISPKLFCQLGASCFVNGRCPEGKLTCGKFKEMQIFFKEI